MNNGDASFEHENLQVRTGSDWPERFIRIAVTVGVMEITYFLVSPSPAADVFIAILTLFAIMRVMQS